MKQFDSNNIHHQIAKNYARWCALSSTRSGAPVKKREVVYPLIDTPNYDMILVGNDLIDQNEFDEWHQSSVLSILAANDDINVGWAAKLINVFLKTLAYVGQIGRSNLDQVIHPPIDGGLWKGVKKTYRKNKLIIQKTHEVSTIKGITSYKQYSTIIDGMKAIQAIEGWKLIEVESVWEGANY